MYLWPKHMQNEALQNDFLKTQVVLMWLQENISSSCMVEPQYYKGAGNCQIIMFASLMFCLIDILLLNYTLLLLLLVTQISCYTDQRTSLLQRIVPEGPPYYHLM